MRYLKEQILLNSGFSLEEINYMDPDEVEMRFNLAIELLARAREAANG